MQNVCAKKEAAEENFEEYDEQENEEVFDERGNEEEENRNDEKAQVVTSGDEMLSAMAGSCGGDGEESANCADLNEFLNKNCEKGSMSVDVYAWNTPFGVSSARVMVLVPLKSGNAIVYNGITDSNGKTEEFRLPAPPKKVSLTDGDTSAAAYAGYTVIVEHPDYQRAMFTNVPVFEGVQSVQPVSLYSAETDAGGTEIPEPEL